MPARFVAEMFCDRVAASKIYQSEKYREDSPLLYFRNSNARKNGLLHPETEKKLMELLEILANEGEESAFRAVRDMVKNDY